MRKYFIGDFFGNVTEVSKKEYYMSIGIWYLIPIVSILALLSIIKDTFY